ncbi:stellacyanin-like [Canna indica]|uniref:Stellacyanin-like n=1 Tax=Canna indica TaxID=4628 RepID=A0AAQ3JW71_9LILI|nr:stellacyanin-like [Canna indica]
MARYSVVLAAVLLISCVTWVSSTDYTVGDSKGWELGVDYSTWASDKKFAVGDKLVFNYGSPHNVEEVSSSDYASCSSSSPISTDTSGSFTVTLSATGKRYFICGVSTHCSSGMKLEVDTVATNSSSTPSSPPPPSGTTSPPSGSGTTSLSPAHAIAVFMGLLGLKLALF